LFDVSLQPQSAKSSTLAPSFSTLSTKKIDLEVSVDPLFKKTCADFDEGGAGGLLMNHLGVDGSGKLVFDAGDAGLDVDEEEEEGEEEDGKGGEGKKVGRKDVKIDVSGLKGNVSSDRISSRFRASVQGLILTLYVGSDSTPSPSDTLSNREIPSRSPHTLLSNPQDLPNPLLLCLLLHRPRRLPRL
jgi:hypothetical protein